MCELAVEAWTGRPSGRGVGGAVVHADAQIMSMEIPTAVPVMILPGTTLFPGALLPLNIYELQYQRMLWDSLHSHRLFAVAMRNPDSKKMMPSPVAGLGMVRVAVTEPGKGKKCRGYLTLQGLARVELLNMVQQRPYKIYAIRPLIPPDPKTEDVAPLTRQLRSIVDKRLKNGMPEIKASILHVMDEKTSGHFTSLAKTTLAQFLQHLHSMEDPGQIADMVTCAMLAEPRHRQAIMEAVEVEKRLRSLIGYLNAEA